MTTIRTNQDKAMLFIERALLCNSGNDARYLQRLRSFPAIASLGCMPGTMKEIIQGQPPYLFHGLAFRLATYPVHCDKFFSRWEELLLGARKAKGWNQEYAYWDKRGDHWAIKWDRFYHFLWLLQCYEYFSERSCYVSFPASKTDSRPDLRIVQTDGSVFFAECYFYTKWWAQELLLEELLEAIDQNLILERTHNIRIADSDNPLSVNNGEKFVDTLATLEGALGPTRLDRLRGMAQKISPQLVCSIGDFSVQLESSIGEYQPSQNVQGDPSASWPTFVKEIIAAKSSSNDLGSHRPNLVMVNGLGLDFQLSHGKSHRTPVLPEPLDEMRIYRCGIGDRVGDSDFERLSGSTGLIDSSRR